MFDSGTTNQNL